MKWWSVLAILPLTLSSAHAGDARADVPLAIVDGHAHIAGSFKPAEIVDKMDRNGVTRQVVMPRAYPGNDDTDLAGDDQMALRLAEAYPGRFYPLVGMQRPLLTGAHKWKAPDADIEALIRQTEAKLGSGRFYGIGEFIVRHWAYSPGVHSEQDNPIASELMRRFSALAGKYDVPIVFHMEGQPELVADLSTLLGDNPKTRYVWAHNCGRSKAAVIRTMLVRHPNLFCDLAGMTAEVTGYGTGWPRKESFTAQIETAGVIIPEMKALFEDHPDRFIVGMDVAHAPAMRIYEGRVRRTRELLQQLSPATRVMMAEGNATRVFKLERP